jgi:hypothetical protein
MAINDVQAVVKRWSGAGAELWSYCTSHSKLILRLRASDRKVLYLVMEDVLAIWGPVAWPNSELTISRDVAAKEWIVRDVRAGFCVPCGLVNATEKEP